MRKPHRIQVESAYVECPMCPTTIVGRAASGQTLYARYRFGVLSVRFDPRDPAPFNGAWGLVLMEAQLGEADDSILEYEEIREHSKNVVTWPDELSERPEDTPDPSS